MKKAANLKKAATKVKYVAKVKRAELNGELYKPGDVTDLEGLTPEQIGFCLAKYYYVPDNWDNVPTAVREAYDKAL